MKPIPHRFFGAFQTLPVVPVLILSLTLAYAEEAEEEAFEYNAGGANALMGQDASIGGFLFPELFVIGTGGVTDGDSVGEDYATSDHDPLNEIAIQAVEMHFAVNVDDKITGLIAGFGHQGENHQWEAELEEAFLHYQINDTLAIGGGQFLNTFGYEATNHLHGWQFVNQNLINSRMLNEGELITRGGELIFKTPGNKGVLTLGGGSVRGHAHGHEEGDEHDHEDGGHHFEIDEAGFANGVVSADYKFRLPFDETIALSTSVATGENGFGEDTHLYGFGFQKVWKGHDHGNGPEFCSGALMLQSEFIGRHVEGFTEAGDAVDFDDYGLSTELQYGLSDRTTIGLRHDWISDVVIAELPEAHRFSTALTTFVDPGQRIRARIQYDYTQNDAIEGEHAAWLQIQFQWGGSGGAHNHNH